MICFGITGKGTYWRALELARGLARQGHHVTVMATARTQRWRFSTTADSQPRVTLVESPDWMRGALRSGWDPYNTWSRTRWEHDRQFDVVHAFESRPAAIYPALAWQRRGAKLVMDWCDWFGAGGSVEERPNRLVRTVLRPVETYFEEHFRTRAAGTTVINSVLRRRALALGVPEKSIFLLPNGSDVDRLKPLPQAEARQRLGWALDAPVIGYIGAIFPRDARLMAHAFDEIYRRLPGARLLLAGYCNSPIEQFVSAPQAISRTGHLADYDQISLYLSAVDVCWLPLCDSGANRGRYPLKINDYLALGKPVVVTAVGDIADLVQRGKFGVVCAAQPEALAASVLELWRDPSRREELGRGGRSLAETEFRWEQIADRLGVFYERVVQGNWD
jgi:glycosyltransferase involved in cell wall biosynthesis